MKRNPLRTVFFYFFLMIGLSGACMVIGGGEPAGKKEILLSLVNLGIAISLSRRRSLVASVLFVALLSISVLFGSDAYYAMLKANAGRVIYLIVLVLGGIAGTEIVQLWNRLHKADESINKQLSNMSVLYQKRLDLIPKIAANSDQFREHERSLFTELAKMRAGMSPGLNQDAVAQVKEFRAADALLGQARMVFEAYPQLTSAETVKTLMLEISAVETALENERKAYNVSVETLNMSLRTFPVFLLKDMLRLASRPYFERETAPTA